MWGTNLHLMLTGGVLLLATMALIVAARPSGESDESRARSRLLNGNAKT